jgi:hypothetical protein
MSAVNQLLAKAMSTSSEDEAIACLRMARKKGNTLDLSVKAAEYNGHTAEYWYEKARTYYNVAKKKQESDGLTPYQQQELYNMFKSAENERDRLYVKMTEQSEEISTLKRKLSIKKNEYVAGIFLGLIISTLPAIMIANLL